MRKFASPGTFWHALLANAFILNAGPTVFAALRACAPGHGDCV